MPIPLIAAALLLAAACNGPMRADAPGGGLEPVGPDPELGPAETAAAGTFDDFGLRLFREVQRQQPDENVFLAPSSVAFALAMTHGGAAGETRAAIARVLRVEELDDAAVDAALARLRGALQSDRDDVRLRVANSLWAREGVPFLPEFLESTRERFLARVNTLDFADPGAPGQINQWVAEQTEDRIPTILERIDPLEVLFLVNAVHFKGQWSEPFDPRLTRPGSFTTAAGERISHPMMSRTDQIASHRGDGWRAVRLSYGEDERLAMYLFLPDPGRTLNDFYAQLTAANWAAWMQAFRADRLALTMPRFRVEYSLGLRPALEALGMAVAFDPARADFGGMLPRDYLERNNAYITRVQHKTFVDVNEEGTEAAGATAVGIGIVSMPPEFTVDRPFFLAIRDERTSEVLFAGQVADPR
jgi:serine protease inhibitor